MTLTISNATALYRGKTNFTICDLGFFLFDAICIAGATAYIIKSLAFDNSRNALSWGLIATTGAIGLGDVTTTVIRGCTKDKSLTEPQTTILEEGFEFQLKNEVKVAVDEYVQGYKCEARDVSKDVPCHKIFKTLYLGNATACVHNVGVRTEKSASIPEFKLIITACPLRKIRGLGGATKEDVQNNFNEQNIKWEYIGAGIGDNLSLWMSLVYACTLLNEPMGEEEIEGSLSDWLALDTQKTQVLHNKGIKVQDWFEPIFKEIDDALERGENVLVHCQHGVSRSAAILIAYMVKRYDIEPMEAMKYLASKRNCVMCPFMKGLNEYRKALNEVSILN